MIELDHVFVASAPGAPEADDLAEEGFVEGPPNTHPGQGTACRRVFFENAYLEFLWLVDRAEAEAEGVRPTALAARADVAGDASHVGLCFRRGHAEAVPPVPTWDYRPPWLPPGPAIPVATPPGATREPFVFFLPPPPARPRTAADHPNGVRRVDEVRITGPQAGAPSETMAWLATRDDIWLRPGADESVTLILGGARRGGEVLLPTPTPLRLLW